MREINDFDVAVIGAGHAGCEAALAAARMGFNTIVFTVSVDSIALMPCNPNIGGSSKGHLVREVDALGGEMGRVIDRTFIQSKMLNSSKGPAVHSLRAQADKADYSRCMRRVLENQERLTIKQAEVSEIIVEETKVKGVKIFSGITYYVRAVILCTGVYLNSRCLCGEAVKYTGPSGLQRATYLSDSLQKNGIEIQRYKTGTPARMDGRSIDFSRMKEQFGDVPIVPFSFSTDPESIQKEQVKCYLTYTNERTHEIIKNNLDRSPLFAGVIEGVGPRYCPSIEDKVVKFADKDKHQVFLEPEGLNTNEWYVDGMSSSLPEDVQIDMYRTVPGLENARIVRNAYAIEYDCIKAMQLLPSLEFKKISGLFAAGQINGSSGYEEAAAQGIIAGINAGRKLQEKDAIIIDRSEGYIGVLIDDLVTKEGFEPYRMMTSRAEYRLLLRQDNADIRLREKGYEAGLVSIEEWNRTQEKVRMIQDEIERLDRVRVGSSESVVSVLRSLGSADPVKGVSLKELIRRPELDYEKTALLDSERQVLPDDVINQINIEIKYQGYIERERKNVKNFKRLENRLIPDDIDYDKISGIRIEGRQKLSRFKPVSIGQASRIQGVSPADIQVLIIYIDSLERKEKDKC
ncbi:MAG: tRNA uridine-5-carboxymethylaminomethyl(34) synthesis enzyme MnmG [Lachnospiraceae bacterium]|nr:tRNA uridine-5-carboxymethylaminomethyl(34) synthesis enzyme MnmG [Lachnospiraceae bacterium]